MFGVRQLIVIALVIAAILLWKRLLNRRRAAPGKPPAFMETVQCAHCGVHLPAAEAVSGKDRRYYCCYDHRLAHDTNTDTRAR